MDGTRLMAGLADRQVALGVGEQDVVVRGHAPGLLVHVADHLLLQPHAGQALGTDRDAARPLSVGLVSGLVRQEHWEACERTIATKPVAAWTHVAPLSPISAALVSCGSHERVAVEQGSLGVHLQLGPGSLRLEMQGSARGRVRLVDVLLEQVRLNVVAQVPLVLEQILLQGAWDAAAELFAVGEIHSVVGQWLALHQQLVDDPGRQIHRMLEMSNILILKISQAVTRVVADEILELGVLGQVSGLLHSLVPQDLAVPNVNDLAGAHVLLYPRDLLRERELVVSFRWVRIVVFVAAEGGHALLLVF